jgi:hypothetical protein
VKFAFLLLALCTALLSPAAKAQSANSASLPSIAPVAPRIEGTIASGGITARLEFEAPDKARIETPALIIVAQNSSTLIYENATRRVRRLPWNVVREPWRGSDLLSGGPANAAIFGMTREAIDKWYRPATVEAATLVLQAKPEAARRVRDIIGTNAARAGTYYAVSTASVFDVPQQFGLYFKDGVLAERSEGSGPHVLVAKITSDVATKLPTAATANGTTYVYNLKTREAAFPTETFEIPNRGGLVEDARLPALAELTGNDAATILARGRVTASHLEDYNRALQLFAEAAALAPTATAPHFLAYETALAKRDLARATLALNKLSTILGENSEVFVRRANVATLRRDWPAALTALESTERTATDEIAKNQARLLRAGILRSRGELPAARTLLLDMLKSNGTVAVEAASTLAQTVISPEDIEGMRAALPVSDAGKLAGALLDLQAGRVPQLTPDAFSLENRPYFQNALALAAARAGRLDYAATLATDDRLQILLGALRGDATSLKTFRESLARTPGESVRGAARSSLINAWAKSFRLEELKSALDNRALAAAATSDDWRSALFYQESRGTLEEIGSTVRAGAARFPDSAWWHSRLADQLLQEREATPSGQTKERARLRTEALEEIEQAQTLDPAQIYYPMQYLLALVEGATKSNIIVDVAAKLQFAKKAETALASLETTYPDNSDAALLAAFSRIALTRASSDALQAVEAALAVGTPDEGDRHTPTFFARQALAMHWRRLGDFKEATRQYELLLDASRTSSELSGIVFNYLPMLIEMGTPRSGDATAPAGPRNYERQAALLERLAREPWPLEQHNAVMAQAITVVLADRSGALPLGALLMRGNAPRQLAGARLQFEAEQLLNTAAAAPDAPPSAERALHEVQAQAQSAVAALNDIAVGEDKILAARALILLAEREANFKSSVEAARLLRLAIALEPNESGLRVALADALLSAKKTEEAIAVRDALLREVAATPEMLKRAAALSLRLRQPERAAELAQSAQLAAQLNVSSTPADVETASFVLARALWADGKTDRAAELYRKLALPQWPRADRAAALIDWIMSLRATGGDAEAAGVQRQLEALGATQNEIQDAERLLQSL